MSRGEWAGHLGNREGKGRLWKSLVTGQREGRGGVACLVKVEEREGRGGESD